MRAFLQFTVTGLTDGSIFAVLALGWVLVYRVSGMLFLVAGEFTVLGALTTIALNDMGVPIGLAIVAAIAIAVAISTLIELVIVRSASAESHFSAVILLLGVAIVFQEVMRRIFGGDIRRLSPFLPRDPITIFGASVLPHQIFLGGVVAALVVVLWIVLERTTLGKAMLAAAQNPTGAMLVGISPTRVRTASFAIAAALAAIGGVLLAPISAVTFAGGIGLTIRGFIAAALGMWSFPGAVAAGVFVGLAEAYGAGYVSSVYKDVFPLALLLAALIFATLPFSPLALRRRLNAR